jgi:hypothetical protein
MPKFIRILPGGRRLLMLAVPALLAVGTVVAAYFYSSAGAPAPVQDEPVVANLGAGPDRPPRRRHRRCQPSASIG